VTRFIDREVFDNPLRDLDPAVKLLVAVGALLAITASTSPAAPLSIGIPLAAYTVHRGNVSPRVYAKYFSVPLSFGAVTVAFLLFLHGDGSVIQEFRLPVATLSVTSGGLDAASLVLARFVGGTAALLFLALSTPPTQVFSTLRRAGLPPYLAEVAFLTYRYTFLLLDEAVRTRNAQKLRGGTGTRRRQLRSSTLLAGSLFLNTYERGEQLDRAMRSRCYDGEMPTDEPDPGIREIAAAALFLAGATLATLLTRNLTATEILKTLGLP